MQKESCNVFRQFGIDSAPVDSDPASIYAERWATSPQPKTPALTTEHPVRPCSLGHRYAFSFCSLNRRARSPNGTLTAADSQSQANALTLSNDSRLSNQDHYPNRMAKPDHNRIPSGDGCNPWFDHLSRSL